MTNEKEYEMISKKANYYSKEKKPVHILTDGRFYNGTVEYVGEDFLIIKDRKLGEVCVLFAEMKGIEPFVEEMK